MKLLTPNEAGRIAGVSGQTIRNLVKDGKLSASVDDKGHMLVDPSELGRLYPEQVAKHLQAEVQVSQNEASSVANEVEALRRECAILREQLRRADLREEQMWATITRLSLPASSPSSPQNAETGQTQPASRPQQNDTAEGNSVPAQACGPEQSTDGLRGGLLSKFLGIFK